MIFSSVFNSLKGGNINDDDDTSGIMKNNSEKRQYDKYSLDNDEDRYLLNTPQRSTKSLNFNSGYLDDGDYYRNKYQSSINSRNGYDNNNYDNDSEIILDDTLQKIKKDYEKSKQQLQYNNSNNFSYKSIFGNGQDMDDANDKLLKLRLKNKSSYNNFKNQYDINSFRDDSIYNFNDLKSDRKLFGYENEDRIDSYTPLKSEKTKTDLELENLELKYRLKLDNLSKKGVSESRQTQNERFNNNDFYNDLKLQLEADRYNDKLNEYKESIQKQTLQLQRQDNVINDLENKYLKLCSLIGEQKEEVLQLKDGLINERQISMRLNNRLEILNERLSETKSLLYKTQLQKENSNINRVRFSDDNDNGVDQLLSKNKKNYPLRTPLGTPPLTSTFAKKTNSYQDDENEDFDISDQNFDMDNTQYVLKLANKYQS